MPFPTFKPFRMHMRAAPLFVCYIAAAGLHAQAYIPLLDTTATWQDEYQWASPGPGTSDYECTRYHLEGDTTVNDTAYRILRRTGSHGHSDLVNTQASYIYWYHNEPFLWLREDTTARRIYAREPGWPFELLYYDFSGTIVTYPWTYRFSYFDTMHVTAVDTTLLSDGPHRRIWMDGSPALIEGLGSADGLVYHEFTAEMWLLGQLACHTVNGVPNFTGLVQVGCTCDTHVGIATPPATTLQVYPSPTTGLCRIQGATAGAAYTLFALDGSAVRSGTCTSGATTIDLTGLRAGMYALEVVDGTEVGRARIVKE